MNAKSQRDKKLTSLPILGSIILAIITHICCIGPVVLAVLGVGGAGLFSKFANLRPYLMGMTGVFLGLAFYLTYKKRKVRCEDGTCKIRRAPKWNKIALWAAMILVVFFLAFPYLVGSLNTSSVSEHLKEEISEVTIPVEGMTCSGCEFNIENAVKKLDGIIKVKAGSISTRTTILKESQTRCGSIKLGDIRSVING